MSELFMLEDSNALFTEQEITGGIPGWYADYLYVYEENEYDPKPPMTLAEFTKDLWDRMVPVGGEN